MKFANSWLPTAYCEIELILYWSVSFYCMHEWVLRNSTHSTFRYHFFSIHDSTKTRCNEYGVLGICGQNRLFFQLFQSHARDNSCQLVGRSGVFHFPTARDTVVIPDHNFKIHIRHSVSLWITKYKLPLSNPTRLQPSSVGHKVLLLEFQRLAWSTDQPTNQWLWLDTDTEVRSRT